ncbi:hypothetical protein, partial [Desulfonatronospira sp. MSAO_Bac3]|uniref:hypothetical protein n=1 Tax=Desulfonatronospira sp. MSAO_Bac3 TaxID=2293857 RepID=UPI00257A17C2
LSILLILSKFLVFYDRVSGVSLKIIRADKKPSSPLLPSELPRCSRGMFYLPFNEGLPDKHFFPVGRWAKFLSQVINK